jgi:glycosyltransferase involved in cell wall biosynthesis
MQLANSETKTNRMRIVVYANCWNEIRLLPYFIQHYNPFVERFVILDDGSTDGSIEYLLAQPKVRLIEANRKGGSYIEQTRVFFNEGWKESRSTADWIITCNIDEHLYHQDLESYLWRCLQDGITILPANGFEMIALKFPSKQERLCDQARFGAPSQKLKGPSSLHDKIMVFNPLAIEEIDFVAGRHEAHPTGNVVYPDLIELQLLHYKFLGLPYAIQRYAELKTGLSSADMDYGMGCQYLWEIKKIRSHYGTVVAAASVIISAGWIKDSQLALSFLPLKLVLFFSSLPQRLSPYNWSKTRRVLMSIRR